MTQNAQNLQLAQIQKMAKVGNISKWPRCARMSQNGKNFSVGQNGKVDEPFKWQNDPKWSKFLGGPKQPRWIELKRPKWIKFQNSQFCQNGLNRSRCQVAKMTHTVSFRFNSKPKHHFPLATIQVIQIETSQGFCPFEQPTKLLGLSGFVSCSWFVSLIF